MNYFNYFGEPYLAHHGVKGMKWGVRKSIQRQERQAAKYDRKAEKAERRGKTGTAERKRRTANMFRENAEWMKNHNQIYWGRSAKDAAKMVGRRIFELRGTANGIMGASMIAAAMATPYGAGIYLGGAASSYACMAGDAIIHKWLK